MFSIRLSNDTHYTYFFAFFLFNSENKGKKFKTKKKIGNVYFNL